MLFVTLPYFISYNKKLPSTKEQTELKKNLYPLKWNDYTAILKNITNSIFYEYMCVHLFSNVLYVIITT